MFLIASKISKTFSSFSECCEACCARILKEIEDEVMGIKNESPMKIQ